jgi:protein-S-isoprenylcysteine O-methyltransferase Ste14
MSSRPPASDPDDHPHVIALPPLIYLAALVIGAIAHVLDPRPLFATHVGLWIGAAMVIAAVAIALWARHTMEGAGTNVNPYQPALQLVGHGPYRFSRNPMYVAMMVGYVGVVLIINGLWPAVMTVPLAWIIQWGVVAREERYLEDKFGDPYRDYRRRTRRWL